MADDRMMAQMSKKQGFIAALDQSGGSTLGALRLYGIPDDVYKDDQQKMFRLIHEFQVRIMAAPAFTGDKVIGTILFEGTMNGEVRGKPTPSYLWEGRGVVPLVEVDRGLEPEKDGVQLMRPIAQLDELCDLLRGKEAGLTFGNSGSQGRTDLPPAKRANRSSRRETAPVSLFDLRSQPADEALAYLKHLCSNLSSSQAGSNRAKKAAPRLPRLPVVRYKPDAPDLLAVSEILDADGRRMTLDRLVPHLEMTVILGEDNGDRTAFLKHIAAQAATASLDIVESFKGLPEDVCLPLFLRFADIAAALPELGSFYRILGQAVEQGPLSATNAQRFGAALMIALRRLYSSFTPAVARIVWPGLWPDESRHAGARPLIVIDDWSGVTAAQQKSLEPLLITFLEQTAASVFLGSRFPSPRTNPAFFGVFSTEHQSILCLWPYDMSVNRPGAGAPARRRFHDVVELRRTAARDETAVISGSHLATALVTRPRKSRSMPVNGKQHLERKRLSANEKLQTALASGTRAELVLAPGDYDMAMSALDLLLSLGAKTLELESLAASAEKDELLRLVGKQALELERERQRKQGKRAREQFYIAP
jgi:hypothetical protein